MSQIFHPSTNTLARLSIFGAVFAAAALAFAAGIFARSSVATGVGVAVRQEVPFSHKHHVEGLGLDCRYCHTGVEESSFAGIPPTATCMNCHSQIWVDSPMLEPVRESFRTGDSLEWVRVHDLADFVYFNHSVHVAKGVGCSTCHGQVDEMPLMWKENSLYMEWCLDCHRQPEKFVRPRDEVFNMDWETPPNQLELGRHLVEQYDIENLLSCSTCHR
ncbi:MAG: cytochrome C [Acidobacteria bacterium]|nr:cytochrome C [Acidobacteriota bacterium]